MCTNKTPIFSSRNISVLSESKNGPTEEMAPKENENRTEKENEHQNKEEENKIMVQTGRLCAKLAPFNRISVNRNQMARLFSAK